MHLSCFGKKINVSVSVEIKSIKCGHESYKAGKGAVSNVKDKMKGPTCLALKLAKDNIIYFQEKLIMK